MRGHTSGKNKAIYDPDNYEWKGMSSKSHHGVKSLKVNRRRCTERN